MLTPRRVITTALIVAVVSLVGVVITLMQPPDRQGLGTDSFGVRPWGLRGLYETTQALDIQTERHLAPPTAETLQNADWLVLWFPYTFVVSRDEQYLQELEQWIRQGGRVLFAPPMDISEHVPYDPYDFFGDDDWEDDAEQETSDAKAEPETQFDGVHVATLLGLPLDGLALADYDGGATEMRDRLDKARDAKAKGEGWNVEGVDYWSFQRTMEPEERMRRAVNATATPVGEQAGLWRGLERLKLPSPAQYLPIPEDDAAATDPHDPGDPHDSPRLVAALEFTPPDGSLHARGRLAAAYALGEGLVVVVAEPMLLANGLLGEQDNAFVALGPMSVGEGKVVFDGFYHGLSIRGQPAWLLTRRPYGVLAAVVLFAFAVWAWRSCVRLGPPLEQPEPSRRNLEDYLNAMAGLFMRGSKQAFLARELKAGVLWRLARRLRLPPGEADVHTVAEALARRDEVTADRLVTAAEELDLLARSRKPSTEKLVAAARELTKCQ